MSVTNPNIKKLISYLSDLSPDVAVFLIHEIEQHRRSGNDDPIYDLIVDAARHVVRHGGRKVRRMVTSKRLFCMPFDDMLINTIHGGMQRGRIPRDAVNSVWDWLISGRAPDDLSDVIGDLDELIRKGELKKSGKLVDEMLRRAAKAVTDGIAAASSERDQRRLAGQLGGQDMLQGAAQIAKVLALNAHLRQLRNALPKSITDLADVNTAAITKSLDGCIAKSNGEPEYAFATLMKRLEAPSQMLTFATQRTGSQDAGDLAKSPYAAIGDLVMYDIGLFAHEVTQAIKGRGSVGAVIYWLSRINDYAQCLTTDLDLDLRSPWGRQLVAARRSVSTGLEGIIGKAPGALVSVFRQCQLPSGGDGCPPPVESELFEAERSMVLLAGCMKFRDQFSLNEVISKTDEPVKQYLRIISDTIIADIRGATGKKRDNAMKWMEVAIKFIRIMFGDEEADLLARAADVAAKAA